MKSEHHPRSEYDLNSDAEWWGEIINGKRTYHRENGPAFISYYKGSNCILSKSFYINGLIHNINGPASCLYYRDGAPCSENYHMFGIEVMPSLFYDEDRKQLFILEHS